MRRSSELGLPEVFLSTRENSRQVSNWRARGFVRKIAPRLYTTNLEDAPETLIRRHLLPVLSLLFPNTILSHRSALEAKASPEGTITLTGAYPRIVRLPGVTVRVVPGPRPLEGDTPLLGIMRASEARAVLESLGQGRTSDLGSPHLPRQDIEAFLERKLASAGESALNRLRDRAREIAPQLRAEAEFRTLDAIIGALLGTRSARLSAPAAIARAQGEPYDGHRIETFQILLQALAQWHEAPRPDRTAHSDRAFSNAAFFDAYFSNCIEGTQFEVDEAIDIVFGHQIPIRRPEDAHDVLGTFVLAGSRDEMGRSAHSLAGGFTEFEDLLRARHATILGSRPDAMPGEYKARANRAGETHFVEPGLVRGTLRKGYELLQSLDGPFARAAFMMFLVSEVHPFTDGNGRIARIMANAELISAGETRILIPVVYRTDYMGALRELTRSRRPEVLLHMLNRAQAFVHEIAFDDLTAAEDQLRQCNAFKDSDEARLRLPSELRADFVG
jgi:hypothetical protein